MVLLPSQQKITCQTEYAGTRGSQNHTSQEVFRKVLLDKWLIGANFSPFKGAFGCRSHQKGTYFYTCIDDEWDERWDTHIGKGKGDQLVESQYDRKKQDDNCLEAPEW